MPISLNKIHLERFLEFWQKFTSKISQRSFIKLLFWPTQSANITLTFTKE